MFLFWKLLVLFVKGVSAFFNSIFKYWTANFDRVQAFAVPAVVLAVI